jgi:DNA-nicking Smr family endonuclease
VKAKSLRELQALREAMRERDRQADAERRRAAEQAAAQRRESDLFARAVGPVTPLRHGNRAHLRGAKPEPVARQRELDEQAVLREALSDGVDAETLIDTDHDLSFRRAWVGPDVLRKLRRGVWVIQGQIDLHGLTRDQARDALAAFVQDARRVGWRCVRVVHGKGIGSPGRQPVLKAKVRHWLVQRQEVIAFAQARGSDGGAGALVVLLDA